MHCPHCRAESRISRKGYFPRKTGPKLRIMRFLCRGCGRHFSEQTHTLSENHRRPDLNQFVYLLLNSGVSQRRTARLLQTTQTTVARKLVRLGCFAEAFEQSRRSRRLGPVTTAVFDEMETFEHSKCKPLSIAVAVEEGSRRLIAAKVAQMPAKGRLAAISLKKYGYRKDHRRSALAAVLKSVSEISASSLIIKSDQCPRYPKAVKIYLPSAIHFTFKGRKACVVGQGELKAGGFDPLFSLNHTCAMFRDNLKRLARRTWCTTKRPDRLQCLVNIYICAHNAMIDHAEGLARSGAPTNFLGLPAGAEV